MGVIDRNVCYAWSCGHVFFEIKAAFSEISPPAPFALNFIAGLGGSDITPQHIERAIDMSFSAAQGRSVKPVTWFSLE